MIDNLQYGITATAAYFGVSAILMLAGFVLIDALIPGKIKKMIWDDSNMNAALVLASGLLANAAVIFVAIWTSGGDHKLSDGLISTLVYGALGLILQAAAFFIVDLLTPGKLGQIVATRTLHANAIVLSAIHIAVGLIVAASIS